ncbi:MAG TPA: anti-sigma factor, partial [Abditibacteriaceae bacterium]
MKTPLSCHTVNEDLKAFLDGELSFTRRLTVQFHLRQCAQCRAEVETMTQISHDLQKSESTTGTATIAPELRERILQNLPDAASIAPSLPPIKRKTPRFLVEYSAAFCLVAVVLVASFSLMGRRVSNTFNAAATQMSEGNYESVSGAASQSAPMTGTVDQLAGLDKQPARIAKAPTRSANEASARYKGFAEPLTQSLQKREASSRDTSNLPAALRRVHKEARLTVAVDDIEAQSAAAEQSV